MSKFPEKTLINKLQSSNRGDAEFALSQFMREHSEALYWLIRRMTGSHDASDDILQNTWIKIWKNRMSFQGDAAFYTWAYRIAKNETLNYLKREKSDRKNSLDESILEVDASLSSGINLGADAISNMLLEAIEELPEKQALVFQLRYFEDLSYKEIAEKLNMSEGGLKANFHHARQKIELFLKGKLNH